MFIRVFCLLLLWDKSILSTSTMKKTGRHHRNEGKKKRDFAFFPALR